jgi:hypothetical protein
MVLPRLCLALALGLAGGLSPSPATAGQSTAELISIISPGEGEHSWLSIPWETDLMAARRRATAENKPIFLWEMDGHPLGCT